MSSTGTTIDRSQDFSAGGATMRDRVRPAEIARPPAPAGRTVAERPIRWSGRRTPVDVGGATRRSSASSRSSDRARWAPRLVPASACTSSTITVCTERSMSRAAEVSIRNSDSGVVIKMSGGRVTSARRSAGRGVARPDADRHVGRGLVRAGARSG